MRTERWTRVRRLFEDALEVARDERGAWLERRLADEPEGSAGEVRGAVLALLEAEEDLDDFLEPPVVAGGGSADAPPAGDPVAAEPPELEAYGVVRLLGTGGMGAVYEAEQRTPRRRVALKVLHPTGRSPDMLRRFADEAELLARLQHPGIARLYEAGVARGAGGELPWFAMELVAGARSVVDHAREEGLDARARVALLRQVCEAVHHGHQRGVIHRDLKPANVLVGDDGRPVVIDFGVARATDAAEGSRPTRSGTLVGTLAYMSPEQVAGPVAELDVRTDVYSLGVLAYELLTDRPPFALDGLPLTQAARVVCREEVPAPSRARAGLSRELDWIVARAVAKERGQRYDSAAELGRDLGRFLRGEAVEAGPRTHAYRARAFVRRNRLAVGAAAAVGLAVVAGLVGTGLGLVRALAAEDRAGAQRAVAREEAEKAGAVTDFLVDVLASAGPGRGGLATPVGDVLESASAEYRERFAQRPAVRARLGAALGEVFHGLGADERAEGELRDALAALTALSAESGAAGGPAASDLADARGLLGTLFVKAGRLDEAEPLLEESLAHHRTRGERDRDLFRAEGRLGRLRLAQERRDEAEALLRSALEGLREVRGPAHRDTCLIANSLAGVLHESRRLEEAEPLYRAALAGLSELWGDEHPDTLRLRHNLAMLRYQLARDPDAAVPELAAVLRARVRVLGADHPDTLASLVNLAGLHHLAGRLDRAAELYDEGLAAARPILGPEHPALQTLTMNAAALDRERGRYERATERVDAVLALRRRTFGAGAESTLDAEFARIGIDRARGEPEAALTRCLDALGRAREHLGDPSLFAYHFEREAGRILLDLGRLDEAQERLVAAAHAHAALAPSHAQLAGPEPELAELERRRTSGGGRAAGR